MKTDIGKTYQYSVREAAGTDTKYTYDQVSATVAITVQEKDGRAVYGNNRNQGRR